MAREIEIDFDFVTGTISAEASGYKGNACSLDVNQVMQSIGVVLNRKMKKEDKDRKVLRHQNT
jgi:hypothetical protein